MLTLLLALSLAPAKELAGVNLPDTVELAGATLKLNGAGLREFLWLDIYVGGLYLPTPTRDAKQAIEVDAPKRIVMHFIYKRVPASKMLDTFREGMARQSGIDDLKPLYARLETLMQEDVVAGDVIVLDYVPGKGVSVVANGKERGTLGDARFMRSLWTVFLGDPPANETLKAGLLGG